MKRFLLRVLLLCILCLGILLGLSRGYLKLVGTDYLLYNDETLKFKTVPMNIQYAGFGSSHSGASFRTELFPAQTAFNFSISGQSVVMDNVLYMLYRDHLAKNAVVALTISPMTFYYDSTGDMTHMKRYCNALPVSALPNVKTKLYRLFRVLDFRFEDILEYYRTRSITDYAAANAADIKAGIRVNNDKSLLNWEDWGAELATTHRKNLTSDPKDGINDRVSKALHEMLSDCTKRGYRVALYTPPFTNFFWGSFDDELKSQLRIDAMNTAEQYNIPYFDYSEDARFCQNMSYFEDVDHMSKEGSAALITILMADILAFYE